MYYIIMCPKQQKFDMCRGESTPRRIYSQRYRRRNTIRVLIYLRLTYNCTTMHFMHNILFSAHDYIINNILDVTVLSLFTTT